MTGRDTFFEAREVLGRNPGKTPIFGMPSAFDSSLKAGTLLQYGTLQKLFEICLSLEIDPDSLVEIEKLLHHQDRELQDSAVNYLQKKKTGKEMWMNIQIGEYKVNSIILESWVICEHLDETKVVEYGGSETWLVSSAAEIG